MVKNFLVLTAHPGANVLNPTLLGKLPKKLPAPDILAEGEAVEYALEKTPPDMAAIEAALAEQPIDINIVPAAARQKKLFVADLESTIIEQECLDELARVTGKTHEVAAITQRAMRDEIEFKPALKERVAMLADLPETALHELAAKITLMPGAETLLATLQARQVPCLLVSGGFRVFAEPIAKRLQFDDFYCNDWVIENGKLTGEVKKPIVGRETKANIIAWWCDKLSLPPSEVLAVGDGANDMDMLALAGMGVAFRAKPKVANTARFRVRHADLTALLYLQGFKKSEFVNLPV